MTPVNFCDHFAPYARQIEKDTGISAVFILAQAAIESGWGERAPGNMFFGVKDTDGVNGNEQLITTTEFTKSMHLPMKPGEEIIHVKPVVIGGVKKFKWLVRLWFRRYNNPGECFADHAKFFFENPRYKDALKSRMDPHAFARKVAAAGYATGPAYETLLMQVIETVKKNLRP